MPLKRGHFSQKAAEFVAMGCDSALQEPGKAAAIPMSKQYLTSEFWPPPLEVTVISHGARIYNKRRNTLPWLLDFHTQYQASAECLGDGEMLRWLLAGVSIFLHAPGPHIR